MAWLSKYTTEAVIVSPRSRNRVSISDLSAWRSGLGGKTKWQLHEWGNRANAGGILFPAFLALFERSSHVQVKVWLSGGACPHSHHPWGLTRPGGAGGGRPRNRGAYNEIWLRSMPPHGNKAQANLCKHIFLKWVFPCSPQGYKKLENVWQAKRVTKVRGQCLSLSPVSHG